MKNSIHRLLALLLLMVATGQEHLCAQVLFNNDTSYFCVTNRIGSVCHNYDEETDPFDSWGIIDGLDSTFEIAFTSLNVCGNLHASMNGYIDIWDGNPNSESLLIHFTDTVAYQVFPITSDHATFHIHYNGYHTDTTFHYRHSYGCQRMRLSRTPPSGATA